MKVWKVALAMTAIAAIGLTACKKKEDAASTDTTATAPAADNSAATPAPAAAPDANAAATNAAPAGNMAAPAGDMKNAAPAKK